MPLDRVEDFRVEVIGAPEEGPGGMPVFAPLSILELLMDLIDTGMLSAKKVSAAVRSA